MAKDILAAVGEFVAKENMNEDILKLIEDNSDDIENIYKGLLYTTFKENKNNELKNIKISSTANNNVEQLQIQLNLNDIKFEKLKSFLYNKVTDNVFKLLKLNKEVKQNRWQNLEFEANLPSFRLSAFKGPVLSLNRTDGINWDGLVDEEGFYNLHTADKSNAFSAIDGHELTGELGGEFSKNWLYAVDWTLGEQTKYGEQSKYEIDNRHAYNKDSNDRYASEFRYKGCTILGVKYNNSSNNKNFISLGGEFDYKYGDVAKTAGFNEVRIDTDLKVKENLNIVGKSVETNNAKEGVSFDTNEFKFGATFDTPSKFNKYCLFNDQIQSNVKNDVSYSIKCNSNIVTDRKFISTDKGCYINGNTLNYSTDETIDWKKFAKSDGYIIFDGTLNIATGNLHFLEESASIIFGTKTFYKSGTLDVTKLKTDSLVINDTSGGTNVSETTINYENADFYTSTFNINSGSFNMSGSSTNFDVSSDFSVSAGSSSLDLSSGNVSISCGNGSSISISSSGISMDKLSVSGDLTTTGAINSGGDVYASSGSGTFYGTATAALYADLAENYKINKEFKDLLTPGTVVSLSDGSDSEIVPYDENLPLAGVISTAPGFLLNSKIDEDEYYVQLALNGRVPVKTTGTINKGMYLIPSKDVPGSAQGLSKEEFKKLDYIDQIELIGISLSTDKNDIVEAKVK